MGIGAPIEHSYCDPVAEALATDMTFARFFLERANRSDWVSGIRCLKDEQTKKGKRRFWWKDWYCHKKHCSCPNLSDTQIDILAIFERQDGRRLGIHIECKHPRDTFKDKRQAARYRERLECWTQPGKGPRSLPAHDEAIAILICDRSHKHADSDIAQFDAVIFFDEISARIKVYPAAMTAN